jgi:hypothetical protein
MKSILIALFSALLWMNGLAAETENRFFEMRTYYAAPANSTICWPVLETIRRNCSKSMGW